MTLLLRFGAHSAGEIPVPIPNTEVKPSSADYTALRETRKVPNCQNATRKGGFLTEVLLERYTSLTDALLAHRTQSTARSATPVSSSSISTSNFLRIICRGERKIPSRGYGAIWLVYLGWGLGWYEYFYDVIAYCLRL